MKTFVAILALLSLIFLTGCEAIINHFDGKSQYYSHKVVIYDELKNSYLGESNEWVSKKSQAKSWYYYEAVYWLDNTNHSESLRIKNEN